MTRQLFQHHPTFGHHFIPRLRARVVHEGGGYLLRTNGAGFRCRHEFVRRSSPGTRRVLLFGDSYTAGDGVSDKHRYGDLLERLVPGLEVFNFGLSGTGTDQQYLVYRDLARELDHDLVVIGVMVENIRRVAARFRRFASGDGEERILAKPYFTLEAGGALELHQVPVPRQPLSLRPGQEGVDRGGRGEALRRLVNRLGPHVKDRIQRLTRYQPLPEYGRSGDPAWRLLRAILLRWAAEARAPVLVVPIPLYQYVEGTAAPAGYRARFQELADPPRLVVHDPLPDFLGFPREERRAFRFLRDCHPTPAAHRVLARSLAARLETLL